MSEIQDHLVQHPQQQQPSIRLKSKSTTMTIGITAGAEDAKYHTKYKELKRKVKDIEESNEKLLFKVEQAKQSIRRMKMERAILYERLNGPSPAVHDRPPPPHSHQHGVHHPQQHSGHSSHTNPNLSSISRQPSHIHENDVPIQEIHQRSNRQGGPPPPHSASSMNDSNHTPNMINSQIPPPPSVRSPRRISSSSGAASTGDPSRHHAGPPPPAQQPHAGAPLPPPPNSAGSVGLPYDGPPGPPPRTGFSSHPTTSPAMHHAHANSSHHSRTRSHSSSQSRPHLGTPQSQHPQPPPPPTHRGSVAVAPPPNYPESMYGPSQSAPAPMHSPPLSERDLREREREPLRDRDRTRDRDGVRERDREREDRERDRERDGRSRRAPSGAGSEMYHPGYDYNSPPHMHGDAHLSPYERAGPLPVPSSAGRDPPMAHMSTSPRGHHAHPTRIHAHQRVGPGAHIQQDEIHERRGGDLDWEREREHRDRDRRERDRNRERDKREDKEYPASSSYLSPHSTHRSHRERDREYDAPHQLRDHSSYYPDSAYGPGDRGPPPPPGPSYPPPLHGHRSETPNSGSGADRDGPSSRPDSRTGYYSRDPGHSSHAPATTSPRPAHIGAGGGRSAFRVRPPHDDPEYALGGRDERDRLGGGRSSANGASSVSPAPPPGLVVPPPANNGSGSGGSTPITGGQRPPKRSRNDMDVDSEPENGLGADGRRSGAATPRDGERNSKRYHRDSRRDIDEAIAPAQ